MLEQLKKQCYALQGKKHSIGGDRPTVKTSDCESMKSGNVQI